MQNPHPTTATDLHLATLAEQRAVLIAQARALGLRVVDSDEHRHAPDVLAAIVPAEVPIDKAHARQIGRHAKACLMHFRMVEDLAEEAGLGVGDMLAGGLGAFLHDVDHMVEALDSWAINTAGRSGFTRRDGVYDGTEKWCQTPGGVLPTGRTKREEQ